MIRTHAWTVIQRHKRLKGLFDREVMRFGRVYFTRSPSSLRHRAQPWLLVFVQGGRGARRPLPGHAPTEAEPQGVTLQVEHPGTGHRASKAYWRTWRSLPERGGHRSLCAREPGRSRTKPRIWVPSILHRNGSGSLWTPQAKLFFN